MCSGLEVRDPRVGTRVVGTHVFGCRGPEHGNRLQAGMGSRVGELKFENHGRMDASQVM